MVALLVAGLLVLLLAALAAAYWYSLSLPGEPYAGPPAPPTAAETDLAERLRRHVEAIASEPHNVAHYPALERSAAYIEGELKALGYDAAGAGVRNRRQAGAQHLRRAGAPRRHAGNAKPRHRRALRFRRLSRPAPTTTAAARPPCWSWRAC